MGGDGVYISSYSLDFVDVIQPVIPVLFGIITPIFFTVNGILVRKLTDPEFGLNFHGKHLSFSA